MAAEAKDDPVAAFPDYGRRMLLFVNGKKIELDDVQPETSLLEFLRSIGLSGTKLGCNEGGCGACTVMVSSFDAGRIVHRSVNACLAPLASVDSCAVTTVEGIGSSRNGLHPVQERIAKLHGSQCGFCTPGIVMALYTFLRNNPRPTAAQCEEALDGNLCRCTGYRPILDAAKSFATDTKGCCGGRGGKGCCMSAAREATEAAVLDDVKPTGFCRVVSTTTSKLAAEFMSRTYDGAVQLVFPSYLQLHHKAAPLVLAGKQVTWFRPVNLEQLLAIRAKFPESKLVGGSTEISIEVRFGKRLNPMLVHISTVPELRKLTVHEPKAAAADTGAIVDGSEDPRGGLEIGGAVTLTELREKCKELMESRPQESRTLAAIHAMLKWFASTQIRNVALMAGNIATASPVSDLTPSLMASGAVLKIVSPSGEWRLESITTFFTGYRRTVLKPGDVIESIFVPFARQFEYIMAYQQARRRDDDIALVGAAYRLRLKPSAGGDAWVVEDASCGFGSMAATTCQGPATSAFLKGKVWSRDTLTATLEVLQKERDVPEGAPGGMPDFRSASVASFFFKFFMFTVVQHAGDLKAMQGAFPPPLSLADDERSAVKEYHRPISTGTQTYDVPKDLLHTVAGTTVDDERRADAAGAADGAAADGAGAGAGESASGDAAGAGASAGSGAGAGAGAGATGAAATRGVSSVGGGYMHPSAAVQVSGEARYTDDIPDPAGCAHLALVTSTRAHAKIVSIDTSAAEAADGFITIVDASSVPGYNSWGIKSPKEEEVFATKEVHHRGQIILAVAANTRDQATAAAHLVKVEYEDLPAILDIDAAIAADSYMFDEPHVICNGDVDKEFEELGEGSHTLEGELYVGGQEHFYLETNSALALPGEAGEGMTILCSTQAATKTQSSLAKVLHLPSSRVVVKVKRIGGGFGGKESRSVPFSLVAGVAAHKLGRPARINIERNLDMLSTGLRHAFLGKYKVGFTAEGKFKALKIQLYANAGFSPDLTQAVMDRALFHVDNAYNFGIIQATGYVCKTNLASNTAFRGFGGPQGMMVCEAAVDHVASHLGKPVEEIRRANMYKSGDLTHYYQPVDHWFTPDMWDKLVDSAEVDARKAAIAEFNRNNKHRKRGLAVLPTKYGINFTAKFLNQAGALVHLYTDGTVLVTHGGVEMGQGLHLKVLQIAADELGVPVTDCHIDETATDKVANTSPTAASASSDLYGGAVKNACDQLNERLKPFMEANPEGSFADIVRTAYFARVNLSAQGFYATPKCGYDFTVPDPMERGQPFSYYTNGVAVSEVEVDTLTGDFHVLRSDVFMDLGCSINPTIDIGQIEGAFVQGMGWCTMEEVVWGDGAHKWMQPRRTGDLLTCGPGFYKIPSFNDVPIDFRVSLLRDAPNPAAVHSSKAVGEPPFFMGATVLFALKDAIYAARRENGVTGYFPLDSPATVERIRMSCVDDITVRRFGSLEKAAAFRAKGSY